MDTLCSNIFLVQIVTSGVCICGAIYCLAFVNQFIFYISSHSLHNLQNAGDNLIALIFNFLAFLYNISEIFVITYFGNDIKLSSNRLSYCLFQSDWTGQPQSTQKNIVIFGEYLKHPHEIKIGKLYPLTLETFRRVCINQDSFNFFFFSKNSSLFQILNSAYSMFNLLKSLKK